MHAEPSRLTARQMMNKVPEITLYFWVIKVLCTTVGETASDYLAGNLNLGLTKTTFITGALLIVVLVAQFRLRRYVAGVYWLGIVLISVVGTQITDNLTDNLGVSLVITTIVFSVALAIVFAVWYASERTLFRLRRDEAGLVSDHDELDAVSRAQLREDAGDVRLDRQRTEEKGFCDFAVRASSGDEAEYFELAPA
jgi:uncharacterized membrane-anchored protein